MHECDTLLMVGTNFPWSAFLPKDGATRAVQIDMEASIVSLRYPTDQLAWRRGRHPSNAAFSVDDKDVPAIVEYLARRGGR
jgi:hypothetical protein